MSSEVSTSSSGGIGLFGAMFLLFLGLKLGGVIHWSWMWVTAPLWIPFLTVIAIWVIVLGTVFACDYFEN